MGFILLGKTEWKMALAKRVLQFSRARWTQEVPQEAAKVSPVPVPLLVSVQQELWCPTAHPGASGDTPVPLPSLTGMPRVRVNG